MWPNRDIYNIPPITEEDTLFPSRHGTFMKSDHARFTKFKRLKRHKTCPLIEFKDSKNQRWY